jgi:hypothetical protein
MAKNYCNKEASGLEKQRKTPPSKDLSGELYGSLSVSGLSKIVDGRRYWDCVCACGNSVTVRYDKLTGGRRTHCGCLSKERNAAKKKILAISKTPEYEAYLGAKKRCNSPSSKDYPRYGERGIKFLFDSFEEFINEIGYRPTERHSLDRIDNDKNYEAGNVRWATTKEQARNTSRNVLIEVDGDTKTAAEWINIYSIKGSTLYGRLARWGCPICSLTLPPMARFNGCVHRLAKNNLLDESSSQSPEMTTLVVGRG